MSNTTNNNNTKVLWAHGRWGVCGCRKCQMKHEAGKQAVMDLKLGCQQNWAERILNPNQILAQSERGGSSEALH